MPAASTSAAFRASPPGDHRHREPTSQDPEVFNSDCRRPIPAFRLRHGRRDHDRDDRDHRPLPLPVHDSFLVADVDAGELRRVMKKVARRRGLPLKLKEKRQTHTTIEDLYAQGSPLVPARPDPPAPLPPLPSTPPLQSHPPLLPLHMWVTQFDQGLQEEGFRPERALETRSEPCPVREETAEGRGPPSREGKPRKRRTQS